MEIVGNISDVLDMQEDAAKWLDGVLWSLFQARLAFENLGQCHESDFCRWTFLAGFDTQALVGRADPHDHVEFVVVLPSFIEKVRHLAFHNGKGPLKRFLFWMHPCFLPFSIGPLELQQKQKESWNGWVCSTKDFAKSGFSRIPLETSLLWSIPAYLQSSPVHLLESLQILFFSSSKCFVWCCFEDWRLKRRKIQAQWEEVDDEDDQGKQDDQNDGEAEFEDFNRWNVGWAGWGVRGEKSKAPYGIWLNSLHMMFECFHSRGKLHHWYNLIKFCTTAYRAVGGDESCFTRPQGVACEDFSRVQRTWSRGGDGWKWFQHVFHLATRLLKDHGHVSH